MCCESAHRRKRNRSIRVLELRIPRLLTQSYVAPKSWSHPAQKSWIARDCFPRRPALPDFANVVQGPRRHKYTTAEIPALEGQIMDQQPHPLLPHDDQLPRRHFLAKPKVVRHPIPQRAILSCSQHSQPQPASHANPRIREGNTRCLRQARTPNVSLDPAQFDSGWSSTPASGYLIPFPAHLRENKPVRDDDHMSWCTLNLRRCRHSGTFPQLVTHTHKRDTHHKASLLAHPMTAIC